MSEPIRFYMDEHVPVQVARGLRRHGIGVATAQEKGRCGLTDRDQLAFATDEGRVIVTFDVDYLALHHSGIEHSGIVWSPERKHGVGRLIKALQLIHGVLDFGAMRNHLEHL